MIEGTPFLRSGALFSVYWLMRLDMAEVQGSASLGGQNAFCLGVDETTWETNPLPTAMEGPFNSGSSSVGSSNRRGSSIGSSSRRGSLRQVSDIEMNAKKRTDFLLSHDWMQMHALILDAGMLTRLEGGGVEVCVERTRAMLVLTAIHDVMKIEELLPRVQVCSS